MSVSIFQQASVVTGVLSLAIGVFIVRQKSQKYLNDHELHGLYFGPAEIKEIAEILRARRILGPAEMKEMAEILRAHGFF